MNFIHIKNDNWSETPLEWIQVRDGTKENPHLIENISIDISNSPIGYEILIEDSDDHYILRNNTIYKSESSTLIGIYIRNSTNGIIIGNNCSKESIYLYKFINS